MKEYKVVFSSKAQSEITEARKYYNHCRNDLGLRFTQDLKRTIKLIEANPLQFPKAFNDIRKACVKVFPFNVFYFIHKNSIKIIAVFHTSRNPKEWEKRKM